jgi:ABC-type sugar transport system ATPase subunit
VDNVILKMQDIHKRFPGVYALNSVNFELRYGEVHALLGENGAGKSTLIKILAGIYQVDQGEIFIKDRNVLMHDVHTSQAHGVSVIHQELCLVPHMTVAENIFLGRELAVGEKFFVDDERIDKEAQRLLDSLGLEIQAGEKIFRLSVAQQQMVEIAKALSVDADIIIMDEPTASLTEKEVDTLFDTIMNLKRKNIAIIYISHRMEELFKISDRVTVLRDGMQVGTKITASTTREELISMMVGRELKELYKKSTCAPGKEVLEVRNLRRSNVLNDISFTVREGEILGVSGLVGAGRTDMARAIFGIDPFDAGCIVVDGKEVSINSPVDAMNNGIALVPENRKEQGLVLIKTVAFNMTITVLKKFMRLAKVDSRKEDEIVANYIRKLSIKTPSPAQVVGNLSGGNQQKIVIAKWLATSPKVLILDEPTRGVDVGAKAEIYSIMAMLAEQGVAIIMISSDLPEIINMSDRVLVMHQGRITADLAKEQINQEIIMHYATGGTQNAS